MISFERLDKDSCASHESQKVNICTENEPVTHAHTHTQSCIKPHTCSLTKASVPAFQWFFSASESLLSSVSFGWGGSGCWLANWTGGITFQDDVQGEAVDPTWREDCASKCWWSRC